MSKTYKTRPVDVRMADPREKSVIGQEEFHNHVKGYCDLPENNIKAIHEQLSAIRAGEWPVSNRDACTYQFAYKGVNICACKLCSGQEFRIMNTRHARRSEKQALKQETLRANTVISEIGDVDEDQLENDLVLDTVPKY